MAVHRQAGKHVDQQLPSSQAGSRECRARAHAQGCANGERLGSSGREASTHPAAACHASTLHQEITHSGRLVNDEGEEGGQAGMHQARMWGRDVVGCCMSGRGMPAAAGTLLTIVAAAGGGAIHVAKCGLQLGLPASQAGPARGHSGWRCGSAGGALHCRCRHQGRGASGSAAVSPACAADPTAEAHSQ